MGPTDESFHEAARQFIASTAADDVYHVLVTHADQALGCDVCRAGAVTDDGTGLVPQASSADAEVTSDRPVPLSEGIAGHTYQTGSASIINDLAFTRSASAEQSAEATTGTSERSVLSVPIGDFGVFQALDQAPGAFTQQDLEWVEELSRFAVAALDRIHTSSETGDQGGTLDRAGSASDLDIVGETAHDLRNPLTVASGYQEAAREEAAAAGLDTTPFDKIEETHTRIDQLVDEMFVLSGRRDAGSRDAIDLEQVATASWGLVPSTEAASLVVEGTVEFQAHPSSLKRVFENLFRNAIDHAGPAVTVRVGPLDERAGFYVADDGPGIPELERARLSGPSASTVTRETDSQGLGLRIVRRVIDAHGWELEVTSSRAGGTRFEIAGVDVSAE